MSVSIKVHEGDSLLVEEGSMEVYIPIADNGFSESLTAMAVYIEAVLRDDWTMSAVGTELFEFVIEGSPDDYFAHFWMRPSADAVRFYFRPSRKDLEEAAKEFHEVAKIARQQGY